MATSEQKDELPYFARCPDDEFWVDRERVACLIELYRRAECLWNTRSHDYKKQGYKKTRKQDIGKHFGWTGN
jgi:hypothetical protein